MLTQSSEAVMSRICISTIRLLKELHVWGQPKTTAFFSNRRFSETSLLDVSSLAVATPQEVLKAALGVLGCSIETLFSKYT